MIICVCRGISELEIEEAINGGTLKDLFSSRDTVTGDIVSDCGLCVKLLEKRIAEIKQHLDKHT